MSVQQIVRVRAQLVDGVVALSSDDPRLRRGSDDSWTFTIERSSPPQVVLEVFGNGGLVVRSALRNSDDTWGEWVEWRGTNPYCSPAFVHSQDFRVQIAVGPASNTPPVGGGFFQIREEGGGGGL